MYHQTRGGTRGGAAEFKWTDVSADKDRENYLGHSINAPTGRWQKNKDVHWYNRDKAATEQERLEEIRKVKEAEEEALSVALGFKPNIRPASIEDGPSTSTVTAPAPTKGITDEHERKEEKRRRKEEKRATRKLEKDHHKRDDSDPRHVHHLRHDDNKSHRSHPRSTSPIPPSRDRHRGRGHEERDDDFTRRRYPAIRSQSRSRSRSTSPHRHTRRLLDGRDRSHSPPPRRRYDDPTSRDRDREHPRERERERRGTDDIHDRRGDRKGR